MANTFEIHYLGPNIKPKILSNIHIFHFTKTVRQLVDFNSRQAAIDEWSMKVTCCIIMTFATWRGFISFQCCIESERAWSPYMWRCGEQCIKQVSFPLTLKKAKGPTKIGHSILAIIVRGTNHNIACYEGISCVLCNNCGSMYEVFAKNKARFTRVAIEICACDDCWYERKPSEQNFHCLNLRTSS